MLKALTSQLVHLPVYASHILLLTRTQDSITTHMPFRSWISLSPTRNAHSFQNARPDYSFMYNY